MAQAWANPYSGLAQGLMQGQQMQSNAQQLMMQKAEAKAAKEFQANTLNLKLAANEALPEADRIGYFNAVIDYSNKLGGTNTPKITNMASIKGKDIAQLLKIAENKDLPIHERLKMMPRKAAELGIVEGEYKPLMKGLEREQRRGLMYQPDTSGLPEKTVDIAGFGLTRPEIPSRGGGLTQEGKGLTPSQRQTYIETGQAQAPRKAIDAKDKGAKAGSAGKRSKDAFAYMKTVLQKPDEYGMVQELDAATARKATMKIDALMKQFPNASPQRIGELAIQQIETMPPPSEAPGFVKTPLKIDKATAMDFLKQSGGDKDKARQLAMEAGYQFYPWETSLTK
jgi:hypothetical protein